jgi:adenylyltransferase/sulfurtransferase
MTLPRAPLTPAEAALYRRHIALPEIGLAGQERLKAARVLVVGVGGLGSPAALYLAAAGAGTIGLADHDRVEAHNLQRQILHGTADVGRPKTASGADRLAALAPQVRVVQHPDGVRPENALSLFSDYDLVVDGSDNFPTRYLCADAAFLARRPLVHGSIFKFEGQVALFDPRAGGACYRCLFPEPPAAGEAPTCAQAGVIGALCGIVGAIQALEAVKLLSGAAPVLFPAGTGRTASSLAGRLLLVDALAMQFRSVTLQADPDCPLCGPRATIRTIEAARYAAEACPASGAPVAAPAEGCPAEIDAVAAAALLAEGRAVLLDVREPDEWDICHVAGARHLPMGRVAEALATLPADRPLLVLCHHGGRSRRVTEFLRQRGFPNAGNVRGGIDAWARGVDPSLARY